jgi:chromate transport protein ChrA
MQAAAPPLPAIASRLGYAGLLPFLLGAALVWVVWPDVRPYVSHALSAYAAVVVAFLGAVHWGLAMRSGETRRFVWSVVPALVAAVAVMMPPSSGLVIHGVMLVASYLVDRRVYPALGLEGWLTLRFRLSALAALSCFVGAAGTPAP